MGLNRIVTLAAVLSCVGCGITITPSTSAPVDSPAAIEQRETLRDRHVQQVLNRFAFGGRPGDAARVRAMGVDRWVSLQLTPERIYERPTQWPADVQSAKLARAVSSDRQLQEVMVGFWENHFSVFAGKGQTRQYLAAYDRDAIRPNALGNFRDLLGAVAKSPAMLYYLDNWRNTADQSGIPTTANNARRRVPGVPGPVTPRARPAPHTVRLAAAPDARSAPAVSKPHDPPGKDPKSPAAEGGPPATHGTPRGDPPATNGQPQGGSPPASNGTPQGSPPATNGTPQGGPPATNGTPQGGPHATNGTPQSGPPDAHGTPQGGPPSAHGTPEGGPPNGHAGTPEGGPPSAHGTPQDGPPDAHGTPQGGSQNPHGGAEGDPAPKHEGSPGGPPANSPGAHGTPPAGPPADPPGRRGRPPVTPPADPAGAHGSHPAGPPADRPGAHGEPPAKPPAKPPVRPPAKPPVRPPAKPPAKPPARPPVGSPANPPARPPANPPGRPVTPPANPRHANTLDLTFSRELLELHTLGTNGGFTESDVIEVARAFTGWTIDPRNGSFIFRPEIHDTGEKIVLGHRLAAGRGMQDGEDVLDILASSPATARFVAKKLVTHFVADAAPPTLVERVAQTYLRTGGNISEMIRTIASSPEFFSNQAYRAKVKTPFELVASALRAMGAEPDPTPRTAALVGRLGQPIFGRETPDGWPDRGDAWMNADAIRDRMYFGLALASGRVRGASLDSWPYTDSLITLDHERQVDGVIETILGGEVSPATRNVLMSGDDPLLLQSPGSAADRASFDVSLDGGMQSELQSGTEPSNTHYRRRPPGAAASPSSDGLARVIGLALGAPEFQRR